MSDYERGVRYGLMMQQTMAEILSYLDRVEQQVWDGRGSVSYVSARIRGIIMKGLE